MNIEIAHKKYGRQLNWDNAMVYCQLLVIDGKNDWHLPTKDELYYINNSENDFVGTYYWSSTDTNVNYAWTQNMSSGVQIINSKFLSYYVRPVRTI